MTLTNKQYKEIEKINNQSPMEKCDNCNSEYGHHHLCKGKNCKCLWCKKEYKNGK